MQALLIVLVGMVALYAFLRARGRLQVRRGARNISRILEDTFQEERRPVRVDPAQFSWLDAAFYDQAQHNLEAEGFQLLANVEDETFSLAHTYVRLLNLPDGSIRAAIYEIVVGGPQGRPRTTVRVVELLTELSDGGCVNTTTAPASRLLDAPRGLSREHLAAAIAPGTTWRRTGVISSACSRNAPESRSPPCARTTRRSRHGFAGPRVSARGSQSREVSIARSSGGWPAPVERRWPTPSSLRCSGSGDADGMEVRAVSSHRYPAQGRNSAGVAARAHPLYRQVTDRTAIHDGAPGGPAGAQESFSVLANARGLEVTAPLAELMFDLTPTGMGLARGQAIHRQD